MSVAEPSTSALAVAVARRRPAATVEVVRDGRVESRHAADVMILAADGSTLLAAGDVDGAILPRSCNKPLQAAGMVELGLALPPELLALAGASHDGEPFHVAGVVDILERHGLDVAQLRCPAAVPQHHGAAREWHRAGRDDEPIAHNCSGKHAAMLATCVTNGWSTVDYLDRAHPLQTHLAGAVGALTGAPAPAVATDGCGAPIFQATLGGLARAFGRLAVAPAGSAAGRVAAAFRAHPQWASGSDRDECRVHREVTGCVIKAGAEGLTAIGLADGTGIVFDIVDGAERPRPVIVAALLARLGLSVSGATSPVLGGADVVGEIRPAGWLADGEQL